MSFEEFKSSLSTGKPPDELAPLLRAMWFAGRNDWNTAHEIAQEINTNDGSWVHAYLHRVEGDLGNASYWYSCAGKPVSRVSLDEEWDQITRALLKS